MENMLDQPQDDFLSSALRAYHLKTGLYATPSFCRDWQFGTMGDGRASFHLIGEGECWVQTRSALEPLHLVAGDFFVFPHDDWHMISGKPDLCGTEVRMTMGKEVPFTSIICGYIEFSAGRMNPILSALPAFILIRGADAVEFIRSLSQLLLLEIQNQAIGTRSVIEKLIDALFVGVLRQHLMTLEEPEGLLAALTDVRIRRVLDAIHRQPSSDWTVERLAEVAIMSRSAFTTRFAELMGANPKEYVTRWRMTLAELMLKDPVNTVAHAAQSSGYLSEAAFRKAFKRLFGIGPRKATSKRN